MPDVDVDRLVWIVTGVQLNAELGDRPLAYHIEAELRQLLKGLLPSPQQADDGAHGGGLPLLTPVVVSDVYYLNNERAQGRPLISVGGPGVNAVSAALAEQLSTPVSIEQTLVIQMDLEMNDPRCCVWGMNHLDTVRAVELFLAKGYLTTFAEGIVRAASL